MRSPLGERYRSVSDLIAEALREKLETLKGTPIMALREVSIEDAKREILQHMEEHPGPHYPSDIASALSLDLEVVFDAVRELTTEARIETAKRKREVVAH